MLVIQGCQTVIANVDNEDKKVPWKSDWDSVSKEPASSHWQTKEAWAELAAGGLKTAFWP